MTLRLAASNPDPPGPHPPGSDRADTGPRILAPGAPPSPGPIPNELAQHLRFGEALVWWDSKDHIELGPVLLVALASAAILALVSLFGPELWQQPWSELWKPIAALLSPSVLVLWRERTNQRAVLVTDASVVGVDRRGHAERVGLDAIASVQRDVLRGGLVIASRSGRVRVPPSLLGDTRQAIASQRRHKLRSQPVHDPLGWLP